MKRLILVSALWSAVAFGQQADVTGPELLSGNADAKLQQAAREAKAAGKKLVISAPEYARNPAAAGLPFSGQGRSHLPRVGQGAVPANDPGAQGRAERCADPAR